jgi:5'-nucleotidase
VGIRITRQGSRRYRATAEERHDPAGRPYYWIAAAETVPANEADSDHRAVQEGHVSICPLKADLTHEPSLRGLADWDWIGQ